MNEIAVDNPSENAKTVSEVFVLLKGTGRYGRLCRILGTNRKFAAPSPYGGGAGLGGTDILRVATQNCMESAHVHRPWHVHHRV